ncbi:class II aldolase/adducin family protein [Ponticoccus sp. SC2-23]|uniref:class II aldolase/adducin family protein n=1 Tax=Alexandriicola marinus TaxID=2081710 RepID=UPI000FD8C249|nr:class II aldolase/adducin family protein [Alexandriicola marinus]MBM1218716.1 class II aldolase/adducin family protein [Ponticoccus sp. SC6-9]MBM1224212.1 class II aldolase/adducin family protein [Ponticoccus sp. SC6-15]MBM1230009.1 class II aldolase/adducin family protein [Ponticoccus sp. SC6-38]MBM1233178.1 class II aldolase/adducin family protein [Ponticoccus sp. SC6-45]MBM1236872.1 class II aldolase/adducin family protein [Ponticoccus sp. SC6-49]MBM1242189.1 class II aldolase/adducin f
MNDHVAGLSLDALRQDLAAAFRLTARFGWHESVGNHFSVAVSDDGRHFLMNPKWRHFAAIRASDLLLLDADDPAVMEGPDAPDASAWTIHGALHRARPDVRVILHAHPPHATALSTLKSPDLPPIDMNTARFFGDLAIDPDCGGIADDAGEGARIAAALGQCSVLLMANHGVTCTGATVAQAFEQLYFFEKAAQTVLLALASGQPLAVMSDDVGALTAQGWKAYAGMADAHFAHLKSVLDREEPDYRD